MIEWAGGVVGMRGSDDGVGWWRGWNEKKG